MRVYTFYAVTKMEMPAEVYVTAGWLSSAARNCKCFVPVAERKSHWEWILAGFQGG
jgi:hypothetical protein